MRIAALAFIVGLLTPFAAIAQGGRGALPSVAPLRGVLVDAASGEPVRRARVEATAISPPGRFGAVMSDENGRFSLDVPLATGISVRITKAGYASHTRAMTPQQLRESVPLLVALDRGAAIVGRTVDSAGEPVPLVMAMVRRAGERLSATNTPLAVNVDDRGEFRLGGLAPGRYTIDNAVGLPTVGLRADPVDVQVEPGQEVSVTLLFVPAPQGTNGLVFDASTGAVRGGTMPAPVPPPGTRTIRGVVTSVAGTPLRGASVSAVRGSMRRGASTDARGRFTIAGLAPGEYIVEATLRGYVRGEHGQRGVDLPGVKVVIGADADVEEVSIVLPPAGAVSGIVYDEVGTPLQDAAVQVVSVRRTATGLVPVRESGSGLVRTDDRGQFRAGSLPPGEYVATASFAAHLVSGGVRAAFATTVWPAANDLSGAASFEVRAGEEVTGLTFTLPLVPVVRLSGTVLTSAGEPASGTVRLLLARGSNDDSETRRMQLGPDGDFSFDDVTAGDYVVHAVVPVGPRGAESGRRQVTIARGDPDAVLIRTTSGSTLSGRFVLEGARTGDLIWGYSATAVADGVSWAPATVSNLGSPISEGEPFGLSLLMGPTRLRVMSDDKNWYLKSIVIDGFDAADSVFDFGFEGRAYTDVQVVFSRLGATLTGRATDDRGRPVRDYAVYLFSVDRDKWTPGSRWVHLTRSGGDGSFRIPSVPPGSYWAVAVDRVGPSGRSTDPSDPALLDPLVPDAVSVVVGESETRDVTLRLGRR